MALFHYLFIMSVLISAAKSDFDVQIHKCRVPFSKSHSNITAADIDSLVSTLVNTTIAKGFIATSQGKSKSILYGLAQCRGDVNAQDCENCIRGVAGDIRNLCPDYVDAKLWYDHCLLRYKTRDFIGKVDTTGLAMANQEDVSDPVAFNRTLSGLMSRVKAQAVNGSGGKRTGSFGKGQAKVSPSETVYGVAQCTRDLSRANCAECLRVAYTVFESLSCKNKQGCRVFYGSCYVHYELYPI